MVDTEVSLGEHLALVYRARARTTEDAGIAITDEDALTAPMRLAARDVDVSAQSNNGRDWKDVAHRAQEFSSFLDNDGFIGQQQVDRARNRDD